MDPIGDGVHPQKALARGGGSVFRLFQAFDRELLRLLGAQQVVQGKGGEHLVRHGAQHALFRFRGHKAAEIVHAPLAAGHGGAQALFVDAPAGLLFNKIFHAAELVRDIPDRPLVLAVGHVDDVLLHAEELRQAAEGQKIRIACQSGVDDEAGPGHQALFRRADEHFMIGAESLRQALVFRVLQKGALGMGAGEITAEALAGIGVQPQHLQHFAGREQADHGGLVRVGQGRDHGVHGLHRGELVGFACVLARRDLQLQALGAVARQKQLPGRLRVRFTLILNDLTKAVDDSSHRKNSLSVKNRPGVKGPYWVSIILLPSLCKGARFDFAVFTARPAAAARQFCSQCPAVTADAPVRQENFTKRIDKYTWQCYDNFAKKTWQCNILARP